MGNKESKYLEMCSEEAWLNIPNIFKCIFIRKLFYNKWLKYQEKKLKKSLKLLSFYHPKKDFVGIRDMLQMAPGGSYFITDNITEEFLMLVVKHPEDGSAEFTKLCLKGSCIVIDGYYYDNLHIFISETPDIYKYPLIRYDR
uniref:PMGF 100-2L n=1 Tax=African swine fever virus TaxID=10497 RepID=A0A7G2FR07_ASF|nr:pMGF 100-2L [African swine fever virus]